MIVWWCVSATGCTQASEPSASPTLAPVTLPDLSALAESVRRQFRERDERLHMILATDTSTKTDEAAAYGDLGRLLMASRFNDEAALCYEHAESLTSR